MTRNRKRNEAAIARHWTDIALNAPLVIAQRGTRIATGAGSPAQRREAARMLVEKPFAFAEAWLAVATSASLAAPALAWSYWRSLATGANLVTAAAPWQGACLDLIRHGLAPWARRTRSNARRLSRSGH